MLYRIILEKYFDRYKCHCVDVEHITDEPMGWEFVVWSSPMTSEVIDARMKMLKAVFPARYFTGELVQIPNWHIGGIKDIIEMLS